MLLSAPSGAVNHIQGEHVSNQSDATVQRLLSIRSYILEPDVTLDNFLERVDAELVAQEKKADKEERGNLVERKSEN